MAGTVWRTLNSVGETPLSFIERVPVLAEHDSAASQEELCPIGRAGVDVHKKMLAVEPAPRGEELDSVHL